jgi:hypothetical protein
MIGGQADYFAKLDKSRPVAETAAATAAPQVQELDAELLGDDLQKLPPAEPALGAPAIDVPAAFSVTDNDNVVEVLSGAEEDEQAERPQTRNLGSRHSLGWRSWAAARTRPMSAGAEYATPMARRTLLRRARALCEMT